ncbi:hypothetical protein AQUCO_00200294v1 [Aquilegia coerulea]|uniref:RNase H type-1 domain-containing protein n=2 Tax=Aquilegia coerulea TaxID=218851 RepID=A0A2G5F2H3_AQUCA|nr:hypothetical protein AQUCO_00200294v1 [Aquilegia coerulea]
MIRFFASSSTVCSKTTSHFFNRTYFSTFSSLNYSPSSLSPSLWKRRICVAGVKPIRLCFTLTRFRVHYYSTTTAAPGRKRSKKKKLDPELSTPMEEEKNAFYVVRKGDVVGVYKNLSDCQAQVGSSVCDPSVSVFKGYSLSKDAEEYLTSRGLKNAIYTINAADAGKEDLFGTLVPCPFQQPPSLKDITSKPSPPKRSQEMFESASNLEAFGSSLSTDNSRKHAKLENSVMGQANNRKCVSCSLEFDGASKGNPGLSGAGAVLRADDGSVVWRLREGVGIATNNVAEYRAVLLGLKQALKKGFSHIRVQGDSKLVCMQVQGLWKTKNENMATLCTEVQALKKQFLSFQISHVLRDFNSEADAQANLALNLANGEVAESCDHK